EGHAALRRGIDRVVTSHADAFARPPFGAALAHDDGARLGVLTAIELHAETTAGAVASVAGGTACFLVCHEVLLLRPGRFGLLCRGLLRGGLLLGRRSRVVGRDAGGLVADGFLHARLLRARGKDVGHADERPLLAVATGA